MRKLLVAAGCAALFAVFLGAPPAASSNDAYWSQLWGIRKVQADKAWPIGTGRGATIAVVDTGVDMSHPDLRANIVPGYDFVDGDNDPSDQFGHGTHVAGIAAATANNGVGVAGVAPDAKIMPVRVLGSDGSGSSATVDEGIRYAADHHATVINLSLGSGVVAEDVSGGTTTSACNYAWTKGSICVVAAGNDGFFRTQWSDANAIIVTATGPDNSEASYATGVGFAKWGIAAPGGDNTNGDASSEILSTYWTSKKGATYAYLMGTSMATPHVSGAVAVLRGLGLTPQQTVDRLMSTATNIGSSFTFGHGLLNVAAAVAGLHQSHTSQPKAAGGGSPAPVASSGASSDSSPRSAAQAARTEAAAHASASPGTTHSSSEASATATSDPGLALFSPAPARHGGTSGWVIGFVVIGLGAAGGLGVLAYRIRGRVT